MAAEILLFRHAGHLVPATAGDAEIMDELSADVTYRGVLTRPTGRSIRHHKLLFALIKMAVENYDGPITSATVLDVLKIRTGHVNVVALLSGEIIMTPKSISFVNMGQDDFNRWFEKALVVLCRDFIPGLADHLARREIERQSGQRILPMRREPLALPAPRYAEAA